MIRSDAVHVFNAKTHAVVRDQEIIGALPEYNLKLLYIVSDASFVKTTRWNAEYEFRSI